MISSCLCCGKPLKNGEEKYHVNCQNKMFSIFEDEEIDFDFLNKQLSLQIEDQKVIPGVQKKLSSSFETFRKAKRKTIYKRQYSFIIKFPCEDFPYITEMENLVMNMAEVCSIDVVPHFLYSVGNNQYVYVSRRIDREQQKKYSMEDFCQLTGRLTEDKYQGSYESLDSVIQHYSVNPKKDEVQLFLRILFCYVTGNNDMHLKNFSLFSADHQNYTLSSAYDLLNAQLLNPKDEEQMALTINGKKKNFHHKDFVVLANAYHIKEKVYSNIIKLLNRSLDEWNKLIDDSLLSDELKTQFKAMIQTRIQDL